MEELLQLIRQQLVQCLHLLELTDQLREALVHTAAPAVQRLTKEIEVAVIGLNGLEKKKAEFLKKSGAATASDWLNTQPDGVEKDIACKLLKKQSDVLQRLQVLTGNNTEYLNKNMSYISYNINVMTMSAASTTYSRPEADGIKTIQGSKMFEANI